MATPDWLKDETAADLYDLAVSRRIADKILFQCEDKQSYSAAAFWDIVTSFADALETHGAQRGDRIAVQVAKSVEALALFWACARNGYIFLPLNTAYTPQEVSYFIGDAEPAVFVCDPAAEKVFTDLFGQHCKVLTLDGEGQGSLALSVAQNTRKSPVDGRLSLDWDTPVAILYTSGTTGRSKGAVLSHGNLASNALALVDTWGFTAKDTLIHALPVYHTHGLFTATNTILLSGGSMLFHRSFNADDVIALFPRATAFMGVPTYYTRLLKHERLTRDSVSHMRLFISGSAPLLAETHAAFRARTGHVILERYGMTETSMNTSNPLVGERKAGTVGRPLPHIAVRIADLEQGREVPKGETGMIELKGPNLFKGYWRNPEKTAEDMTRDGYFRTGDVGRIDADGYVIISGRAKDLIITGGFNVYPKEIESLIDAMDGVEESAVIGLPHDDFGEGVTAIVVAKADVVIDNAVSTAGVAHVASPLQVAQSHYSANRLATQCHGQSAKSGLAGRLQGFLPPGLNAEQIEHVDN